MFPVTMLFRPQCPGRGDQQVFGGRALTFQTVGPFARLAVISDIIAAFMFRFSPARRKMACCPLHLSVCLSTVPEGACVAGTRHMASASISHKVPCAEFSPRTSRVSTAASVPCTSVCTETLAPTLYGVFATQTSGRLQSHRAALGTVTLWGAGDTAPTLPGLRFNSDQIQ